MSRSQYRQPPKLFKKRIALRPKGRLRFADVSVGPEREGYTKLEWAILRALEDLAINYQPQLPWWGGVGILGGARWDFVLPDYKTIIRGMGYWHSLSGARQRDFLQDVAARAQGWRVIDVGEEDTVRMREVLRERLGIPARG